MWLLHRNHFSNLISSFCFSLVAYLGRALELSCNLNALPIYVFFLVVVPQLLVQVGMVVFRGSRSVEF